MSARPVRAILNGRRLAYAGAIGAAAVAAGTAATVMIVHRSRRRARACVHLTGRSGPIRPDCGAASDPLPGHCYPVGSGPTAPGGQ